MIDPPFCVCMHSSRLRNNLVPDLLALLHCATRGDNPDIVLQNVDPVEGVPARANITAAALPLPQPDPIDPAPVTRATLS